MKIIGWVLAFALGLYFVGRAVAEPFIIDVTNPDTYRYDWAARTWPASYSSTGGPGVVLAHPDDRRAPSPPPPGHPRTTATALSALGPRSARRSSLRDADGTELDAHAGPTGRAVFGIACSQVRWQEPPDDDEVAVAEREPQAGPPLRGRNINARGDPNETIATMVSKRDERPLVSPPGHTVLSGAVKATSRR